MFIRLTAFFLLIANSSFGQADGLRYPTRFDKFIQQSQISWASYVNDTVWFDKLNLTEILLYRFQKGEIKISYPISRDSLMAGTKITYLSKSGLEQRSYPPAHAGKPTNRVDNNSAFMNVEQILYVTKGKLYSYIPWVTPTMSVYTSSNKFIGTTEYFSSGINMKYNSKTSRRDQIKFIKTTKRKFILDTMPRTNMLKQVYGINLLEAIWKDLLNEQHEVVDLRSGQNTSLRNAKEFIFTNSIDIPVYDSLGRVLGTRSYREPVTASLFSQMELTQNWFYNSSRNVVENRITGITLFVRNKGNFQTLIPAFKIIFK